MSNKGQPDKIKTINELFQASGKPSLKQLYDADILTYKKEYMKWFVDSYQPAFDWTHEVVTGGFFIESSWSRLINFIKDLNSTSPFMDAKVSFLS